LDAASDVTATNSSSVPSAGSTGTVSFVGLQDQSYVIAVGGSVKLIYTVNMPSSAGTYTNSAAAVFGQATTPTASASFVVYNVSALTMTKASAAINDPYNGATNPKLIPGARVSYTVTVSNPNAFALTNNSVVVTDPTPATLKIYVADIGSAGSGPLAFVDGSPSSSLSYSFVSLSSSADDVDFSSDDGATWTYTPVPGSDGTDPAVSRIRIRPRGAMAANSSFELRFQYVIR
jgi:hypothetical protein